MDIVVNRSQSNSQSFEMSYSQNLNLLSVLKTSFYQYSTNETSNYDERYAKDFVKLDSYNKYLNFTKDPSVI